MGMKMNLYFLYTVPTGTGEDEARIVRANNEMHARHLAALDDNDYGMRRWLDLTQSMCSEIPIDGGVGVITSIGATGRPYPRVAAE